MAVKLAYDFTYVKIAPGRHIRALGDIVGRPENRKHGRLRLFEIKPNHYSYCTRPGAHAILRQGERAEQWSRTRKA